MCPQCGGNACEIWQFPKPSYVHWFLNPGLAINEVVLGQRLPKRIYFCIRCDAPLYRRQFVRCSRCHRFQNGMLWGRGNAFGHWFGLFCPDCGGRIKTHLNLITLVVIALTWIIWWPVWLLVRPRWVSWERQRARKVRNCDVEIEKRVRYWPMGLGFGLWMWILFVLGTIIRARPRTEIIANIVLLPMWLAAGALFAFVMKRILSKQPRVSHGRCRACGYDLRGLPSNVCPECGFRFDSKDLEAQD